MLNFSVGVTSQKCIFFRTVVCDIYIKTYFARNANCLSLGHTQASLEVRLLCLGLLLSLPLVLLLPPENKNKKSKQTAKNVPKQKNFLDLFWFSVA